MEHCEKGLKCRITVVGGNHEDTATSYNSLGKVYLSLGDTVHALANFERCLIIRLRVLGDHHHKTIESITELESVKSSNKLVDELESCVAVKDSAC